MCVCVCLCACVCVCMSVRGGGGGNGMDGCVGKLLGAGEIWVCMYVCTAFTT